MREQCDQDHDGQRYAQEQQQERSHVQNLTDELVVAAGDGLVVPDDAHSTWRNSGAERRGGTAIHMPTGHNPAPLDRQPTAPAGSRIASAMQHRGAVVFVPAISARNQR